MRGGGYLRASDIQRINSIFKKSLRYGYCKEGCTFEEHLAKCDAKLFAKLQNPNHCLNHLLPNKRSNLRSLRKKGHPYILPVCTTVLFKRSYLVRSLYNFM